MASESAPSNAPRSEGIVKIQPNIFVSGLNAELCTDDDLISFFEKFGKVSSAMMARRGAFKKPFGFVKMENDSDVDKAVSEGTGQEIKGKVIRVERSTGKSSRGDFSKPERRPERYPERRRDTRDRRSRSRSRDRVSDRRRDNSRDRGGGGRYRSRSPAPVRRNSRERDVHRNNRSNRSPSPIRRHSRDRYDDRTRDRGRDGADRRRDRSGSRN